MGNSIIFIGGIHGVGKTTFCKNISRELSINHYSSSELINRLKKSFDSSNKKTSNIEANQNILLNAIKNFGPNDSTFLLDGHFCLIDASGNIVRIPKSTFIDLGINSIVMIKNSVDNIINNLKSRDSNTYSNEFIEKFQNDELIYSKEVANSLSINYTVFDISKEIDKLSLHLNSIVSKSI